MNFLLLVPRLAMASYGRIVNICSNVVTAGTPNMAHYVASKGAVFSFTRSPPTTRSRRRPRCAPATRRCVR